MIISTVGACDTGIICIYKRYSVWYILHPVVANSSVSTAFVADDDGARRFHDVATHFEHLLRADMVIE